MFKRPVFVNCLIFSVFFKIIICIVIPKERSQDWNSQSDSKDIKENSEPHVLNI